MVLRLGHTHPVRMRKRYFRWCLSIFFCIPLPKGRKSQQQKSFYFKLRLHSHRTESKSECENYNRNNDIHQRKSFTFVFTFARCEWVFNLISTTTSLFVHSFSITMQLVGDISLVGDVEAATPCLWVGRLILPTRRTKQGKNNARKNSIDNLSIEGMKSININIWNHSRLDLPSKWSKTEKPFRHKSCTE